MRSAHKSALGIAGLVLGLGCGSPGDGGAGAAPGSGGASASGSGGTVGSTGGSGVGGGASGGAAGTGGSGTGGLTAGTGGAGTGGAGGGGNGSGGVAGGTGGAGTGGRPAGSGGARGTGGNAGTGGAGGAGTGGSAGGAGGAGGAVGPTGFVCNQVTAMTLTREWFEAGFESDNGIVDARWQLKAMEHGYIFEWANPSSTFWSTPVTSPCAQQTTSPDRIVLTVLSWTITAESDWETQIANAVATLRMKYPAVRRIDLITVVRGPGNMLCSTPPAAGETIVMPPELDAAIAAVAARFPGLVYAGPRFEAPSCAAFSGGGPHLTGSGNTAMARTISAYFAPLQ